MSRIPKSITNFITTPCRVAHSLDWRQASGSILSLRITNNLIDIAVASHPSCYEPVQPLSSIPLVTMKTSVGNRKVLDSRVAEQLAQVVRDFNVCGMVVGWPVQKEGWCGAPYGRVFHSLDQLMTTTASQDRVFHKSRHICLYDLNHHVPAEDEWGRSPIYSQAPSDDRTLHIASEEQYNQEETGQGVVAVDIWNDFCQTHWPEFCHDKNNFDNKASSLW